MDTVYDAVALGELLIDFIHCGNSEQGNPIFEANPGGAPCNVLSMLAKLGHSTAFIGKVGEDAFGRRLGKVIEDAGISEADSIITTRKGAVCSMPDKSEILKLCGLNTG